MEEKQILTDMNLFTECCQEFFLAMEANKRVNMKEVEQMSRAYAKSVENPEKPSLKKIGSIQSIINKVIAFFKKLRIDVMTFYKKMLNVVTAKQAMYGMKKKSTNRLEYLKQEKEKGVKYVRECDIVTIAKEQYNRVNEIYDKIHKIVKKKYYDVASLERDIAEVQVMRDNLNTYLDNATKQPKDVKIDTLIDFLENESCGKGYVTKSINTSVKMFDDAVADLDAVKDKMQVDFELGLIPKKLNFLQRSCSGITDTITKIFSKVIAYCCWYY